MASTNFKFNFVYISVTLIFSCCSTLSAFNSPNFKLPTAILPTKYNLYISTQIHQNVLAFKGRVAIDLTIREPTNEIVLNSNKLRELNITLINLDNGILLKFPQLEYVLDEAKEQLRIHWPVFPLKLQIGQQYRLEISYFGDIQENEVFGFFKSTYVDENNSSVPIAVTHFEPTSARLAFPCFDEPAFEAKFVIAITHGSNYSAISNMPADGEPVISSISNGQIMVTTKFLETPKMSTYLVAFALTNYNRTSVIVNGLEHRFFYSPNSKDNGSRALENAVKTVNALEKIIGIPYALTKLDQIQLEELYGLGMENWGLMTFHKKAVFSNQKDYNKIDLLTRINVQNHEIAHQWFGNLVTPASWNCVWLKEGLSTYFSYIAANLVYPEEKIFEYFLINEVAHLYSMNLNHPMTHIIAEGANIKKSMDVIAYHLGGSFFRMFHHAIGHSTFMKGINKYLLLFQYSIADEDDFFRAMQAAVDEDNIHLFQNNQTVANVMRTWTHNVGIPIVTVIRNYDTGTITIRQKSKSKNKDQKWWIPMSFVTAANPDFERTVADFIMPPKAEVTLDLKDLHISLSNSDWLIVNKQQIGIFYTVYDNLNLKLITEALIANQKTIPVYNRALILRDISVTFDEELDAIETLLGLLEYLKLEKESLPWLSSADLILKLLSWLEGSELSHKFNNFVYDIFDGIYDEKYQHHFENFTATDLKARPEILKIKFEVDAMTCQNYTTQFAKDYFLTGIVKNKKPCKISLCEAMKNITFDEFESYLKKALWMDDDLPEVYEFQTALKCVETYEIFEYVLGIIQFGQSEQVFDFFEHILISNKLFDTWISNLYNVYGIKGVDTPVDPVYVYRSGKVKKRETFLKKYESSIRNWLERYEKKQGKSEDRVRI